jgi:hypothetical protein
MWRFQGSNTYYIKLQARRINLPVSMIKLYNSGTWKNLKRTSDNFFISNGDLIYPLVFPIQVQAISYDGAQVIQNSIQSLINDQDIVGTGQFNGTTINSNNPLSSSKLRNIAISYKMNFLIVFIILIIFI